MYLQDIARVIRSKNAGPRCTTLDIMFNSDEDYNRVVESKVINRDLIAKLYDMPAEQVNIIEYPMSRALKIVIRAIGMCTAHNNMHACSRLKSYERHRTDLKRVRQP